MPSYYLDVTDLQWVNDAVSDLTMTKSGNLGSSLKKHNSQTPVVSPSWVCVCVCVPPESYQCYLCPTVNRGHLVWLLPVTDNFKHIRCSWLYLNVLIYIGHWYLYGSGTIASLAGNFFCKRYSRWPKGLWQRRFVVYHSPIGRTSSSAHTQGYSCVGKTASCQGRIYLWPIFLRQLIQTEP